MQRTVLVVEDEEVMRSVLADKLKAAGYNVSSEADGERGLARATSDHPDLILLDNRMPNMSGFAVLKRLRDYDNWGATVPVIFFSNVDPGSKAEREDLESVGPTAYLMKSETNLDDIVAKIRETLETQ